MSEELEAFLALFGIAVTLPAFGFASMWIVAWGTRVLKERRDAKAATEATENAPKTATQNANTKIAV
jgi:hypothetical protein